MAIVAALVALLAVGDGVALDTDLDTWLSSRVARLRSLPEASASAAMREDLGALRQLLVQRGTDIELATALIALPEELLLTDSRARAVAALQIVRRRLDHFEAATHRTWPETPGDARARLEQILKDDAFNLEPQDPAGVTDLLTRIQAWIGSMLARMFHAIASRPFLVRAIAYGLITVLVIALGWVIVRLLARGPAGRRAMPVVTHRPVTADVRPAEVLSRAQRFAGAGQWREALGTTQAAAVLALKFRGALPDEPSLTDLEGIDALHPDVDRNDRSRFERLVGIHDRAVYGGIAPGDDAVDEALVLGSALVRGDRSKTEPS